MLSLALVFSWVVGEEQESERWFMVSAFHPGHNGWIKAAGSVVASDLFCICEFVFSLQSFIDQLIDFVGSRFKNV